MELAINQYLKNKWLMNLFCSRLELKSFEVQELQKNLYLSYERNLTQGKQLELTFSAIIYYHSKLQGIKNKDKELAKEFSLNPKHIRKHYRRIKKAMGWKMN